MSASALAQPTEQAADLIPKLDRNLEALSIASLKGQLHALVVARQASIGGLASSLPLAMQASHHQGVVKSYADFYLNNLLPQAIHQLTDADALNNLYQALGSQLEQLNREELLRLLTAIMEKADGYRLNAEDSQARIVDMSQALNEKNTAFGQSLKALVDDLESEDGSLNATKQAIENVNQAIADNINHIIDNSNVIGNGLKALVTFAFSVGASTQSDAQKKSAELETPSKDATPSTQKAAENDADAEAQSFPAEGISAVSSGVEGIAEAVAAIRRNNEILEELHQTLAELDILLSASVLIEDQSNTFAERISGVSVVAETVSQNWQAIVDDCQSLKSELEREPSRLDSIKASLVTRVSWFQRMGEHLKKIQQAYAGFGDLFPPINADNRK